MYSMRFQPIHTAGEDELKAILSYNMPVDLDMRCRWAEVYSTLEGRYDKQNLHFSLSNYEYGMSTSWYVVPQTRRVCFFGWNNDKRKAQPQGGTKQLMANRMALYSALGMEEILSKFAFVGSYAFARYGFVPESREEWCEKLRPFISERCQILKNAGLALPDDVDAILSRALSSDDPKSLWDIADIRFQPDVSVLNHDETVALNGVSHVGEGSLLQQDFGQAAHATGHLWFVRDLDKCQGKTLGQILLLNGLWSGRFDMNDQDQIARVRRYTGADTFDRSCENAGNVLAEAGLDLDTIVENYHKTRELEREAFWGDPHPPYESRGVYRPRPQRGYSPGGSPEREAEVRAEASFSAASSPSDPTVSEPPAFPKSVPTSAFGRVLNYLGRFLP